LAYSLLNFQLSFPTSEQVHPVTDSQADSNYSQDYTRIDILNGLEAAFKREWHDEATGGQHHQVAADYQSDRGRAGQHFRARPISGLLLH
jgi:hypothetical protein